MFTVALFIIVIIQKLDTIQLSINWWMDTGTWYSHTMKYYAAVKKEQSLSSLAPPSEKLPCHDKWSGGRSKCAGWSTKEETWAEVQVNLYTQGSNRNKGSQRPGTLVLIVGLHAYNLELVSVELEYLWPFWSPQPPLRDPPCSYQSGPFGPLPWTYDIID